MNTLEAGPISVPVLVGKFRLHRGHAVLDAGGNVLLDSGQPLFEYAPLLAEMLEPYPDVQLVLTTSWLDTLPLDQVVSYLPAALARRVVGTTGC